MALRLIGMGEELDLERGKFGCDGGRDGGRWKFEAEVEIKEGTV